MKGKLFTFTLAALTIGLLACCNKDNGSETNRKELPEGALPGEFSVSETKKVHFSKGNLYYDGSKFAFEAKQYEYHGYASGSNTRGLFCWSTNQTNYGMGTSQVYFGEFVDWGKAIGDGKTWRTLSSSEWEFLFNHHRSGWATVNGVAGYVLAPKGFAGVLSDSYTDEAALATDNLVFLPAASGLGGSGKYYREDGRGYYWSSTPYVDSEAYFIVFSNNGVVFDLTDPCYYCYSVRLITESK